VWNIFSLQGIVHHVQKWLQASTVEG